MYDVHFSGPRRPGGPRDVRKKSLVLAIRVARDRDLARERQAEGVAKGLVNPFTAGVFLRGGQGLLPGVADVNVILAALDQLDLFHVGNGCPKGTDVRPGAAAVREDHALIESGPYRYVRHPVYAGYLALLLGSGAASLNVCLWLLSPVSLIGILIQAASEEQLLGERFGQDYERYVRRTGRLVPRFWGQVAEPEAAPGRGGA